MMSVSLRLTELEKWWLFKINIDILYSLCSHSVKAKSRILEGTVSSYLDLGVAILVSKAVPFFP